MLGVPATISTPDSTARASHAGPVVLAEPDRDGDPDRGRDHGPEDGQDHGPDQRVQEAAGRLWSRLGCGCWVNRSRSRYWTPRPPCRRRSRRRSGTARAPRPMRRPPRGGRFAPTTPPLPAAAGSRRRIGHTFLGRAGGGASSGCGGGALMRPPSSTCAASAARTSRRRKASRWRRASTRDLFSGRSAGSCSRSTRTTSSSNMPSRPRRASAGVPLPCQCLEERLRVEVAWRRLSRRS